MADIANLRRARKQMTRKASEKQAAENRLLFGASKAAKDAEKSLRDRSERRHEGHRRENGGDAES